MWVGVFVAWAWGAHLGGEEEAVGLAVAAEVGVEGGAGGGELESVLGEAGGGGVVEVRGLGDEDGVFDFGAVPAEVIEEAVGGGGGEVGTELMGQAEAASVDAGHGGEAGADFGGAVFAVRDVLLVAGDGCGEACDADLMKGLVHQGARGLARITYLRRRRNKRWSIEVSY